jgi:DNA adenine methylase
MNSEHASGNSRMADEMVGAPTRFTSSPLVRPLPPFLRWAGGKRWLLPTVRRLLEGHQVLRYVEPFLGGGSIFFGLGLGVESHLTDLNQDLILVYSVVKDNPESVASILKSYVNDSETYYAVRSQEATSREIAAANFIFLNHTSFNGIYRVNLAGKYNVPYGRRANTMMPTLPSLVAASRSLADSTVTAGDFAPALEGCQEGDFAFIDPPYTVAHNSNGFVKYNEKIFSFQDQIRLRDSVSRAAERGAKFVVTNADHASIRELYEGTGLIREVSRGSSVGGSGAARGQTTELLITNLGTTI